jgi:predicted secreted protein
MKQIIKTFLILSIFVAANSVFATSKKKIVKKVNHITTIEEDSEPITIKVKKGKLEGIKLPVKMATGYSWKLSKLADNLKQPFKPRIIQPKPKEGEKEVSIQEYQIFYIRALETGEGKVEFEYKQPFDKDSAPEKEMTVTIEVE